MSTKGSAADHPRVAIDPAATGMGILDLEQYRCPHCPLDEPPGFRLYVLEGRIYRTDRHGDWFLEEDNPEEQYLLVVICRGCDRVLLDREPAAAIAAASERRPRKEGDVDEDR